MTCRIQGRILCGAIVVLSVWVQTALANFIRFSRITDTIQIPGNTVVSTQFTIEARIRILSSLPNQTVDGRIFQEQHDFGEDKSLGVNSDGRIAASAFTDVSYQTNGGAIVFDAELTKDVWHHVAFVRDGNSQRLYVDGSLLTSNTWTAPIANLSISSMSSGGFMPPTGPPFRPSFLGEVDTLRVSSSARYSGDSFDAPIGDLPSDSSTLLLYNFNDTPGSSAASDSSPDAWTGLLGAGYTGATSPAFFNFTPGDANGDGVVDIRDLSILANNWQSPVQFWSQGDFNNDQQVNADDLGILAANWQSGVPLAGMFANLGLPAVVPEPWALSMAIGLTWLLKRARRVSAESVAARSGSSPRQHC